MKVTCCCITFICSFDSDESENEEEKLISSKDDEVVKSKPPALMEPGLQSSKTTYQSSSWDTDDENNPNRVINVIKKSKVYAPPKTKSGLLMKSSVDLKINITKIPTGDIVRIYAIEAANVVPTTWADDNDEFTADEVFSIQVRSKLINSEMRGRSQKYEVAKNFSGSIRFRNECLHSITNIELLSQQIRFRLYIVYRQRRDVLIGEYILDPTVLDLASNRNATNFILRLHNVDSDKIQPPEIKINSSPERQLLSESISPTPRSGSGFSFFIDSPKRFPFFPDSAEKDDKVEIAGKSSAGDEQSSHSPSIYEKTTQEKHLDSAEYTSMFEQLKKTVQQRNDNISQLETASEELAGEAATFGEITEKIKKKYEKKLGGKKFQE